MPRLVVRMSSVVVWLVALCVGLAGGVQDQAPRDGNPLCTEETINGTVNPFFANHPVYSASQRPLMDSRDYVRLLQGGGGVYLPWQTVDRDNNNTNEDITSWIQQGTVTCEGSVTVCGFNVGPQENWLITQHINTVLPGGGGERLRKVTAQFEGTLNGCDISRQCRQSFEVYKWQTSSIDRSAAANTSNYVRVGRVSPDITSGDGAFVDYQDIELDAEDGFYLAVVDLSTCVSLTRILVLYYVCPEETSELISRPEAVESQSLGESASVEGECAENSSTESGTSPVLICDARGQWWVIVGCLCDPGYQMDSTGDQCTECPEGTFSAGVSNGACETCPANSEGTGTGLTLCPCLQDYFRAPHEDPSLPCTRNQDSAECCQSDLTTPTVTVTRGALPDDITPCSRSSETDIALPKNLQENVTFSCELTTGTGTVLWHLGGCRTDGKSENITYQMVDRDEFVSSGVLIQDSTAALSNMNLYRSGRQFLSDQLQSDVLTIQCVAVVDDLNVFSGNGGEVHRIILYGRPSPPEDLNLSPVSSTSALLQWSRPQCMSELVVLTYQVTVTRISNNSVVFQNETSYENVTIEPSLAVGECDEPLMISVVAVSGCTGESDPAILNTTIPPLIDVMEVIQSLTVSVDLGGGAAAICVTLSFNHSFSQAYIDCRGQANTGQRSLNYTAGTLGGSVRGSVSSSEDRESLEISLCSEELRQNRMYQVSLSACDETVGICQDFPPIPISTAGLQSARVVFFGTIVQLSCSFAENLTSSDEFCQFIFSLPNAPDEMYQVPVTLDYTYRIFEVPNTREAYEGFMARFGNGSLSPVVTDSAETGIRAASGTRSTVSPQQLQLSCTLFPNSPAVGCLFVLLNSSSGPVLSSASLLSGLTSCTRSSYQITCCVDPTGMPVGFYRVYAMYDGGLVGSTASVEGSIASADQSSLCPSPTTATSDTASPTITVVTETTTITTTTTTTATTATATVVSTVCPTPTPPEPEVTAAESSSGELSAGAAAGIGVAITLLFGLVLGAVIGGLIIHVFSKRKSSPSADNDDGFVFSANRDDSSASGTQTADGKETDPEASNL